MHTRPRDTLAALPHPNDTAAVRAYTETFTYDAVGNITQMFHSAASPHAWTRNSAWSDPSMTEHLVLKGA